MSENFQVQKSRISKLSESKKSPASVFGWPPIQNLRISEIFQGHKSEPLKFSE